MMKLRPENVRLDKFEAGHIGMLSQEQLALMWKNGIFSVSKNGILGDPRGATATISERCLDEIVNLLVNSFKL